MAKKKSELSFAQAFAEFEAIAEWFEHGEPDLEQGMEKFARATQLAKALKTRLKEAENTIKEIRSSHKESF